MESTTHHTTHELNDLVYEYAELVRGDSFILPSEVSNGTYGEVCAIALHVVQGYYATDTDLYVLPSTQEHIDDAYEALNALYLELLGQQNPPAVP